MRSQTTRQVHDLGDASTPRKKCDNLNLKKTADGFILIIFGFAVSCLSIAAAPGQLSCGGYTCTVGASCASLVCACQINTTVIATCSCTGPPCYEAPQRICDNHTCCITLDGYCAWLPRPDSSTTSALAQTSDPQNVAVLVSVAVVLAVSVAIAVGLTVVYLRKPPPQPPASTTPSARSSAAASKSSSKRVAAGSSEFKSIRSSSPSRATSSDLRPDAVSSADDTLSTSTTPSEKSSSSSTYPSRTKAAKDGRRQDRTRPVAKAGPRGRPKSKTAATTQNT